MVLKQLTELKMWNVEMQQNQDVSWLIERGNFVHFSENISLQAIRKRIWLIANFLPWLQLRYDNNMLSFFLEITLMKVAVSNLY